MRYLDSSGSRIMLSEENISRREVSLLTLYWESGTVNTLPSREMIFWYQCLAVIPSK